MNKLIDKKRLADAIRNGATVRITSRYGAVHEGVVAGENAYAIVMNIGGNEGQQAYIEKNKIANVELVP